MVLAVVALVAGPGGALAQDAARQAIPAPDELVDDASSLVERAEAYVSAVEKRGAGIAALAEAVDRLIAVLDEARNTNAKLRARIAVLDGALAEATVAADEREQIIEQLATVVDQQATDLADAGNSRAALARELAVARQGVADLTAARDRAKSARAALERDLAALRSASSERGDELSDAARSRAAMLAELAQLHQKVAQLTADLDEAAATRAQLELTLTAVRATMGDISAELADRAATRVQLEIELQAARAERGAITALLADAEDTLGRERVRQAGIRDANARLNRQLAELRKRLVRLTAALEASETKAVSQDTQIGNLGQRLTAALVNRVEALERYRSEFFGKLREVLGDRPDIRVVGDRFVFQSEVLFASGSAELEPGGQTQLAALAQTLQSIAVTFPPDLPWVLRIDGHTDKQPISTRRFPSNWELSTARAISVVRFLIRRGIPAERLVAAGFGEHQPLDPRADEIGYRRNRRIEIKLTGR